MTEKQRVMVGHQDMTLLAECSQQTRQNRIDHSYCRVTYRRKGHNNDDIRYMTGPEASSSVLANGRDSIADNRGIQITIENITKEEYEKNMPKTHMYQKSANSGMLVV